MTNKAKETDSTKKKFRTTILQSGKTATGIKIPPEIIEQLGAGKKPPVSVTINGYTYRSTVAVMNGAYMVGISADNRKGAGVEGGDEIDVMIELDSKPREVTIPPDLKKALDKDAKAKQFFDGLSYSNKLRHALAIESAKTDETRQRRIENSIRELREGKK